MKKSVKIIPHAAFWLFFPLANAFAKWAEAHNSFPGFGSEPKPGFFQILHESFHSLLVLPDMGRPVTDLPNLLGISFNFFIYLAVPVGVFYLYYGWLIPKALNARDLKSKLLPVLFVLLAPLASIFIFKYLTITVAWNFAYWLTLTYIVMIVFAVSGAVFRIFENWVIAEKVAKQNLKSELAMLKNQVNPHFLFNTLNNIDSLIKTNADRASETLLKLSDILRYMIYDTTLSITRRRIELIYPGRHFLDIKEEHHTFTVALSLNT